MRLAINNNLQHSCKNPDLPAGRLNFGAGCRQVFSDNRIVFTWK